MADSSSVPAVGGSTNSTSEGDNADRGIGNSTSGGHANSGSTRRKRIVIPSLKDIELKRKGRDDVPSYLPTSSAWQQAQKRRRENENAADRTAIVGRPPGEEGNVQPPSPAPPQPHVMQSESSTLTSISPSTSPSPSSSYTPGQSFGNPARYAATFSSSAPAGSAFNRPASAPTLPRVPSSRPAPGQ